jgi:hypothetical protein
MRARYVHPVRRDEPGIVGTRYSGAWIHENELPAPPRQPQPLKGKDLAADLAHVDRCCVTFFGCTAQSLGLTPALLGIILQEAREPLTAGQVAGRLAPLVRRPRTRTPK